MEWTARPAVPHLFNYAFSGGGSLMALSVEFLQLSVELVGFFLAVEIAVCRLVESDTPHLYYRQFLRQVFGSLNIGDCKGI